MTLEKRLSVEVVIDLPDRASGKSGSSIRFYGVLQPAALEYGSVIGISEPLSPEEMLKLVVICISDHQLHALFLSKELDLCHELFAEALTLVMGGHCQVEKLDEGFSDALHAR